MEREETQAEPIVANLPRRVFLGDIGCVAASGFLALQSPAVAATAPERRARAFQIRLDAASFQRDLPAPDNSSNGDEELYANKIASYSKGLPHNSLGEVDPSAWQSLVRALSADETSSFESIPMGCPDPALRRKLVNPQAGLAFDLEGADSHQLRLPPVPAFSSAQTAGEMVELYWQAVARDVSFTEYATNPIAHGAAADLSRLSDFRGPKANGQVVPDILFRGFTPGDRVGPYISQFLLRSIAYGAQFIEQRMSTVLPGIDYMTEYSDWLAIQNGWTPGTLDRFDEVRCYIRNGRDLARWVHQDVLFQAYFNACLILLAPPGPAGELSGGGMGAPLNPGNPYPDSTTQTGFGTFGNPYMAAQIAEVATRALKAVWYQKWFVHRRLRPEAFGGCVHNVLTGRANYPIHPDLLHSQALTTMFSGNGAYLLPVAYPEGSPLHPSYGAGHATVAGACVTILKALFDESYVMADPLVPGPDGRSLVHYTAPDADRLTVGGELNKLASNIALGRNFAGIHWRSDYAESLKLGEEVAIGILRDQRLTYHETFRGFTFTRFDGTKVTV